MMRAIFLGVLFATNKSSKFVFDLLDSFVETVNKIFRATKPNINITMNNKISNAIILRYSDNDSVTPTETK
jgi:hypothetical protein